MTVALLHPYTPSTDHFKIYDASFEILDPHYGQHPVLTVAKPAVRITTYNMTQVKLRQTETATVRKHPNTRDIKLCYSEPAVNRSWDLRDGDENRRASHRTTQVVKTVMSRQMMMIFLYNNISLHPESTVQTVRTSKITKIHVRYFLQAVSGHSRKYNYIDTYTYKTRCHISYRCTISN